VQNGALYSLQYDVLNDFQPISPLVAAPYVIFGRKTLPANDLKELIGWLKANPDKASAAIVTVGVHLVTALSQKETGTQFCHVPYRGTAPAMQDLVAGQIDFSFDLPVQLPLMRAGSIKAYAVTSEARLATASDIPTAGEQGLPALTSSTWFGFFAPKGTPATSSPSSTRQPWERWTIRRYDLASSLWDWRFSRASGRRRRRSARW